MPKTIPKTVKMTSEKGETRAITLPKKIIRQVRERVQRGLKPEFFNSFSAEKIETVITEAFSGVTDNDLAMVIGHGSELCAKCGECCRHCNPIVLTEED